MQRFEYEADLAEGAYGCVWLCLDRETGQHVAMKRFKEAHTDSDVMRLALREVRMLKAAQGHPNVVKVVEAFRSKSGRVYIAMEYVEKTLTYFLRKYHGKGMPPILAKWLGYQLLQAISHLHSNRMMHRDLKPANLLITDDYQLKLCDFGFARNLHGQRDIAEYTTYVVTRWYRPPEILVSDVYGPKVDMWAFGCLLCEMMAGRPLLPGRNSANQLWLTMRALGPLPTHQSLLMSTDKLYTNLIPPSNEEYLLLEDKFPQFPSDLMHILRGCLALDPDRRLSPEQALAHPFWADMPSILKAMTKSSLPPREFWDSVEVAWLSKFEPQSTLMPGIVDNADHRVAGADAGATTTAAGHNPAEAVKGTQHSDMKDTSPAAVDDTDIVDVAMNIHHGVPGTRGVSGFPAAGAQASSSVYGAASGVNTPAAPRASKMQASVADFSRMHVSPSNTNLNSMLDALAQGASSSMCSAQGRDASSNRPTGSNLCVMMDTRHFMDHLQGPSSMSSAANSAKPTIEAAVVTPPPRTSNMNGEGIHFPMDNANNSASMLVVQSSTLYQRHQALTFQATTGGTSGGLTSLSSIRNPYPSSDGLQLNSCPKTFIIARAAREALPAGSGACRSEEVQCYGAGYISGPAGNAGVQSNAPRTSSPTSSPRSFASNKVGIASMHRLDRSRTQSRLSIDAGSGNTNTSTLTRSHTATSTGSFRKPLAFDAFLPALPTHAQGAVTISSVPATSVHDAGVGHGMHRCVTLRSGPSGSLGGSKRVIAPVADAPPHTCQGSEYSPGQLQSYAQQHVEAANVAPGIGVGGKKNGLADKFLNRMKEFLGGK